MTFEMTEEPPTADREAKVPVCEAAEQATRILTELEKGDPTRAPQLLPLVYEQLRNLARHRLAAQPPGQTLQPTALVHEAYLRVAKDDQHWNGKAHFFAAAAESMRRIVVDSIRAKSAAKRGGGNLERLALSQIELAEEVDEQQLLQIDDLLDKLAEEDEEAAKIVKLRFFVGLTLPDAAQAMDVSERTAKRRWAFARAWLFGEMQTG